MSWLDTFCENEEIRRNIDVPKGKYKATVTDAMREDKPSAEIITLEYTITEGEYVNAKIESKSFVRNNPVGAKILMETLDKLGHNIYELKSLTSDQRETALIGYLNNSIGRDVEIYVNPKEYNGQKQYSISVNKCLNSSHPKFDDQEKLPFE